MNRNELLNDAEAAFRTGLDGRQAQMWTAIPAQVTQVNLLANTIEAQPTIQGVITLADGSEKNVNLPILPDVPICFPGAGGFVLTFPIAIGDEVLVVFSSRCIDAWWQSGGIGKPIESRMHDLSDGFAILAPKSIPNVIPNVSATNAQLRNKLGTLLLELTPSGQIHLTVPSGLAVTGNVSVTGTITATGEVTGNLIPLSTHTHPVTTAPGETGPPVP